MGIVRGLADDVVVAPYATALAAMVSPGAAAANYRALTQLGARGQYGFYEAIDFTASRRSRDDRYAVVRCYMAHHQGMTIVGIHNAVLDGLMRDRFHTEPMVRAAALLLQERAPRDVPTVHAHREELEAAPNVRAITPPVERRFSGEDLLIATSHQLSNGRLTLSFTPERWQPTALGRRWSSTAGDRTRRATKAATASTSAMRRPRSAGAQRPCPCPAGRTPVRSASGRIESVYRRRHGAIGTELEYHLSPEVRRRRATPDGPQRLAPRARDLSDQLQRAGARVACR